MRNFRADEEKRNGGYVPFLTSRSVVTIPRAAPMIAAGIPIRWYLSGGRSQEMKGAGVADDWSEGNMIAIDSLLFTDQHCQ